MLAILFLAGACGTATRPSPQQPDARAVATAQGGTQPIPDASPFRTVPVLIVGDSISVGARDIGGLQKLLEDGGWTPEIVAEVGAALPWAIQQIEPRLVVPRIVVVEMGTNPSPQLGNFENEVRQMIDDLVARGVRHIVWVPPVGRDPTEYADKDAVIERTAGGTVIVSGWPARLQANPQWFGDGLHLTEDGYRQLANFLYQELQPLHG